MKSELHARLWAAQQRWFAQKAQGESKLSLKLQGLGQRGEATFATRLILFTGATRIAYERELKRFLNYAHDVLGRTDNAQIDRKDFRTYLEARMAQGSARTELNKIRAAIVKFGALYGKWESFHAMSKKLGDRIRESRLPLPKRPHVSVDVRQAALDRLRDWDTKAEARSGQPRGYALALELQKEASLRSIEATDRFKSTSLVGLEGDHGRIAILGKGGRPRTALISARLYESLQMHFCRSTGTSLAPLRSYQVALRRAILAAGGRATGSHAQRRTSAVELKNRRYREHLAFGMTTGKARKQAVEDTVEHLGHSRNRKDLAAAYLG
ncbi:MAG TPA: site-specific integrase [Planctomycetota bacterium]